MLRKGEEEQQGIRRRGQREEKSKMPGCRNQAVRGLVMSLRSVPIVGCVAFLAERFFGNFSGMPRPPLEQL